MVKLKKKQDSDRVLISVATLFLILSGLVIFWSSGVKNQNNRGISPVFLQKIGKATLTIDFGGGNKRAFEGDVIENETLIDVLNQAARAGDFSYKLNEKSDLASIGKLSSVGKKSWHWYLNGKKINKQTGGITVKSGDNILIKYE